MEKLLNLLQEFYWENRKFSNDDWLLTMTNWVENLSGAYAQTYIISLMGGFIKWLVENDKIDLWLYREYMPNLWEDFSVESNIIMNLSIAIDPIWYLNYILK